MTMNDLLTESWVGLNDEASDPYDRPCEATRKKCPNVALYLVIYKDPDNPYAAACACPENHQQRLCMACKDWLLTMDSPHHLWRCRRCDKYKVLSRIESLR